MMTSKPDLPSNKQPVYDKRGNVRHDAGKKVLVSFVSGTMTNEEGVVVEGPYWWVIEGVKRKVVNGREKHVPCKWNSKPYWLVRIKMNGFYYRCIESELEFV
jgi:hypothetical protein